MELNGKIRAKHLSRTGYVYIRQSTAYQVMANTESTMRQYALKERMTALGWDSSLVKVIDSYSKEPDAGFVQIRAYILTGGNPVRLRPNQSSAASLGRDNW